ncbi:MAG: response regulator [Spirochaetota bacterium]|nr:response regulator [Spirochaetota bacterium]
MSVNILVVDDETDLEALIVKRFRNQIESGKYKFSFALNGIEALKKIESNFDLDILLLDINMPEMDGLTLLTKINEINPVLKAIIVTAYGDLNNIRTAMNNGAFDFLIKPIDFKDLETTIDKTYQQVKLLKEGISKIKENETLKMYVNESTMNYLLNKQGIKDEWLTENHDGTAIFFNLINFSPACKTESPDELIRFFNYYFTNLSVLLDVPDAKKTFKKIIGSSVLAVSVDAEHFRLSLDACLRIRHAMKTLIQRYPGKINYSPKLSIGLCSGKVTKGFMSRSTHTVRENLAFGDTIDNALQFAINGKENQIVITEDNKKLLPSNYKLEDLGKTQTIGDPNKLVNIYNVLGPSQEEIFSRMGMSKPN